MDRQRCSEASWRRQGGRSMGWFPSMQQYAVSTRPPPSSGRGCDTCATSSVAPADLDLGMKVGRSCHTFRTAIGEHVRRIAAPPEGWKLLSQDREAGAPSSSSRTVWDRTRGCTLPAVTKLHQRAAVNIIGRSNLFGPGRHFQCHLCFVQIFFLSLHGFAVTIIGQSSLRGLILTFIIRQ